MRVLLLLFVVSSTLLACSSEDTADVGRADAGTGPCAGKEYGAPCEYSATDSDGKAVPINGRCAYTTAELTVLGCLPECGGYTPNGGRLYCDCTTPGDTCGGGTCYYDGSGTSGTFACAPTGTKAVAEACGAWDECVAGVQCLELEGSMICFQICTDTCDSGDCTDTGFGFKVCVESSST